MVAMLMLKSPKKKDETEIVDAVEKKEVLGAMVEEAIDVMRSVLNLAVQKRANH